jgi:hypothetical protein
VVKFWSKDAAGRGSGESFLTLERQRCFGPHAMVEGCLKTYLLGDCLSGSRDYNVAGTVTVTSWSWAPRPALNYVSPRGVQSRASGLRGGSINSVEAFPKSERLGLVGGQD